MRNKNLAYFSLLSIFMISVQLCFANNTTVIDSTYSIKADSLKNGDSRKVNSVDFGSKGAFLFDAQVASPSTSGVVGNIELHIDSLKGTLIGTCAVVGTGKWQSWATRTCNVKSTTGVHDLYFKFTGGTGLLFSFNSWKLSSPPNPSTIPSENKCPCDIFKDGGTPCVAAHSTVRALYSSFKGSLYQIKRKSDNKTLDIGVLSPGGFANAAAVDSFLKGTSGTVSIIYDQSERKNDLTYAVWGSAPRGPLKEASANRLKDTLCGFPVYPMATEAGEGYRRNVTNGIAAGQQPEGMYMVASGKRVNSGCCFDYGNAESDAEAGGKPTGAMEALYFGTSCWFSPCNGKGPWAFADLEWGLFQAAANGTTNESLPYKYASAYLKGDIKTYTIRANDATLDALKTMGSSNRPSGWTTNILTGAVILAIGGDSSPSGMGTFYEGAMVIGRPDDATENAVQKNLSLVYSGKWKPVSIQKNMTASFSRSPNSARFNQSSGNAVISYTLQDVGHVKVNIFDDQGRQVASISKGIVTSGQHEANWNTRQFASGLYFWRIALDGRDVVSGKIVVGK
jgi:hypothetical protein